MGTDESVSFNGVVGNRWAWTSVLGSYAESVDSRVDTLTDLRTGKRTTVTVEDDGRDGRVGRGCPARSSSPPNEDRHRAPDRGAAGPRAVGTAGSVPAVVGARVYWRGADGAAQTALLELPSAEPAGKAPLARTMLRCKPKRGARLLQRWGLFVISRAGGDTWACRRGKTRLLARGDVSEFSIVGEREVAYARPGFVGILDVVNGKRRELPSAGGALAADQPRAVLRRPGRDQRLAREPRRARRR